MIDPEVAKLFLALPDVRLFGSVGDPMLSSFFASFGDAVRAGKKQFVVELMTDGGVADVGYRIFEEIRLAREATGVDPVFFGKTSVFSAGTTIMSAFPASRRYLSKNTTLLIHERRTDKHVHITGQIGASIQIARELVSELEAGLRIQNEGFAALVQDTDVSFDEIKERAATGWYLSAQEALDRRMIAGIV